MSETVNIPAGLARNIVAGGKYADPNDWKYDEDFDQAVFDEFNDSFELVQEGAPFLGDPKEEWYQGVTFTAVIRRKLDGVLFGYNWWEPVAKHGEPYYEANGGDFGLDYDTWVFQKVTAFTVTGYEVTG